MGTSREAYVGKIFRIDLTARRITEEILDREVLRKYVGGTGIGARILYDEVPPGVQCLEPGNRLILATGPLAGTRMGGSGTFSVVTKGCLTNGGTATQANGYLGAYLRSNGIIGVVFEGASDRWVYVHIHDGVASLRDAEHLVGLDTWDTESAIKKEAGASERGMSVFGIGPAGENQVKFAAIVGDKGHVAAHNGCGAVMGSKKVKAIAVSRGKGGVAVYDRDRLSALARDIHNSVLGNTEARGLYDWGTSMQFPARLASGQLPVKNLDTDLFPEFERFLGANYRKVFELTPNPCWACQMHHLHLIKVTDGPYAGYFGEEPEYEAWAECGPLIGNTDPGTAVMLSNVIDRIGVDVNEAGWLLAFVMDCYHRGILTKTDTDGLEMTWGNAEAARAMLNKVAKREGFGNILAEGVKRAAERIGGEALNHANYIHKGHAPRGHDHRGRWTEIVDYATSNVGTIETGPVHVDPDLGIESFTQPYSPDQVPYMVVKAKPRRQFVDCLGVCMFTAGPSMKRLVEITNAATGWELTLDEAITVATRNVNLLRCFNIRHGIGPELETPSVLLSSVPKDGPAMGKDIKPHWDHMLDVYYQSMGWDRESGKPRPETLQNLGLRDEIIDLWNKS